MAEGGKTKKPRVNMTRAWEEARSLIWKHRRSLSFGLALMLVNRLAGLVLPASSKYLIDNVLTKHQLDKLVPLALAVGAATVVQAITSFSLSQIVSIAAQRAISDTRVLPAISSRNGVTTAVREGLRCAVTRRFNAAIVVLDADPVVHG